MKGKQGPDRWQTTFPVLLGTGTGILIFVISYSAGASGSAVALRTIVAALGMFGAGKLAWLACKLVWAPPNDLPADDLFMESQELGRNFDVRLEPEEVQQGQVLPEEVQQKQVESDTNGQIDPNLQQNLMDDPERLAGLAQKMGTPAKS